MGPMRLAFTLGDVAGIGPEVAVRAAADDRVRAVCTPILVGPEAVAARAAEFVGVTAGECWDCGPAAAVDVPAGSEHEAAGRAAADALHLAIDAALDGCVDGIVTAPLNKYSLRLAGVTHPGHTEILADRCGATSHAMMLHVPPDGVCGGRYGLSVAHVTLHTSVASVPRLLTTDAIADTLRLVHGFLNRIGCRSPRVAATALNPHGGERGLFGDEESRLIEPALQLVREEGIDASGPFPADTLMRRAAAGEFDGVAAMYHDQGHIALKLLAFDSAVNVTLGLPIVRTSPSHGTAFDIAWQGRADAVGMIGAAVTAAKLAGGAVEM